MNLFEDAFLVSPIMCVKRNINVPSDKSITHRAIMLNSVANGRAVIKNALIADDTLSTASCMRALGAQITIDGSTISVVGCPNLLSGARLNAGNSGTTVRLLTGLLSSYPGKSYRISGDVSICVRPMDRVIKPLTLMGAKIESKNGFCPLIIDGAPLSGINYDMPIASAQVKSAILLAGLNADGTTIVHQDVQSRDHTERMLKAFGAKIECDEDNTVILKRSSLTAHDVTVPGDISSAAYPLVLAACMRSGAITLKNIGINPTRTGIIDVLRAAGCDIKYSNINEDVEPSADITIDHDELKPFTIDGQMVPRLVDEIPVLTVLACFIKGTSIIRGAGELKVKESNRLQVMYDMLKEMGAKITLTNDGFIIEGTGELQGSSMPIDSKFDHRIAMSAAIAGACSKTGCQIINSSCVNISYPNFYREVLGTVEFTKAEVDI